MQNRSNYGHLLGNLTVGDKVGLEYTESKALKLIVNDAEQDELSCSFPSGQVVYALFDLYGQCQQVSL